MRLSLSWIHYRAHKYFKLADREHECLFGAADFALEKGRWYSFTKLAEWNYITKPVAYFHTATYLVTCSLWRCPRCRPHGCSLLRPKNCKPQFITACPQFIFIINTSWHQPSLHASDLAVRWRSNSPTAIGRTPPDGFGKATSTAPASKGHLHGLGQVSSPQQKNVQALQWLHHIPRYPVYVVYVAQWGQKRSQQGRSEEIWSPHRHPARGGKGNSGKAGITESGEIGWRTRKLIIVSAEDTYRPWDSNTMHAFLSNPWWARLVANSCFCSSVRLSWCRFGWGLLTHKMAHKMALHGERCSCSSMLPAALGRSTKDCLD